MMISFILLNVSLSYYLSHKNVLIESLNCMLSIPVGIKAVEGNLPREEFETFDDKLHFIECRSGSSKKKKYYGYLRFPQDWEEGVCAQLLVRF